MYLKCVESFDVSECENVSCSIDSYWEELINSSTAIFSHNHILLDVYNKKETIIVTDYEFKTKFEKIEEIPVKLDLKERMHNPRGVLENKIKEISPLEEDKKWNLWDAREDYDKEHPRRRSCGNCSFCGNYLGNRNYSFYIYCNVSRRKSLFNKAKKCKYFTNRFL